MWLANSNGQYSVRSAYNVMREDVVEEIQDEVFEELWKLKVPSKVATFAWRLLKDRLPTKVNLRRRKLELDDFLCPFCRSREESAVHLFLVLLLVALSGLIIPKTDKEIGRAHV